jgi:hypothetical protein
METNLSTNGPVVYQGLSSRAKFWILCIGALIAVLNLLAAWYFAQRMHGNLDLSKVDFQPFVDWMGLDAHLKLSSMQLYDLSARSIHIVAISKMIANKQSLVLACFGAGFALAAIGFALFVIGADGAFQISSTAPNKAQLVISGTAPGLLCFLLCGLLVLVGIRERSHMTLPSLLHEPVAVINAESACAHRDINDKCYTATEWQKLIESPKGNSK